MEHPALPYIHKEIKFYSFGEKKQLLLLNDEVIALGPNTIRLADITHFRFGLRGLQVGMFAVGRKYQLHLKTPATQLNIVFRTYLKLDNAYFSKLFHEIINGVWLRIGDRLLTEMISEVKAEKTLKFGKCVVSKTGITLKQKSERKKFFIPWSDLTYEKKYNRLVLNSKSQPQRWINLYYLEHWNMDVLTEFLDWAYRENGLVSLEN